MTAKLDIKFLIFLIIYLFSLSIYATEPSRMLAPCENQNDSVFCTISMTDTSSQNKCPNGYKVIAQSIGSISHTNQIKGQIYYPKNMEEFYQYQALGYQPYVFGDNTWEGSCGEKQKYVANNYYDNIPNAPNNVVSINSITQTCFIPHNGCIKGLKVSCTVAGVESIYTYFYQYIAMIEATGQTIPHNDSTSYQLCAKI